MPASSSGVARLPTPPVTAAAVARRARHYRSLCRCESGAACPAYARCCHSAALRGPLPFRIERPSSRARARRAAVSPSLRLTHQKPRRTPGQPTPLARHTSAPGGTPQRQGHTRLHRRLTHSRQPWLRATQTTRAPPACTRPARRARRRRRHSLSQAPLPRHVASLTYAPGPAGPCHLPGHC